MTIPFVVGQKVRIDVDGANLWRCSRDYSRLKPHWTTGVLRTAFPTPEGDGTFFLKVSHHNETDSRNIPVDCIHPIALDKRTISYMLVRMQ